MATRLYNLNIKQLDSAIAILNKKMDNTNDSFLKRKLQAMKNEYVGVENKILRIYDKLRRKNPQSVAGRKNTLTLLEAYRLDNKKIDNFTPENASAGKWNYNIVDGMRDCKGLAVGIGATCVGIGAVDMIAKGITNALADGVRTFSNGDLVAKEGIFKLLWRALQDAFGFDAFGMTVITGGLTLAGAAILVPKISNQINRIKNHISYSREAANQVLKDVTKEDDAFSFDNLAAAKFNKAKDGLITQLLDDPDLLRYMRAESKKPIEATGLAPAKYYNLRKLIDEADKELARIKKGDEPIRKAEIIEESEREEATRVADAIDLLQEAIDEISYSKLDEEAGKKFDALPKEVQKIITSMNRNKSSYSKIFGSKEKDILNSYEAYALRAVKDPKDGSGAKKLQDFEANMDQSYIENFEALKAHLSSNYFTDTAEIKVGSKVYNTNDDFEIGLTQILESLGATRDISDHKFKFSPDAINKMKTLFSDEQVQKICDMVENSIPMLSDGRILRDKGGNEKAFADFNKLSAHEAYKDRIKEIIDNAKAEIANNPEEIDKIAEYINNIPEDKRTAEETKFLQVYNFRKEYNPSFISFDNPEFKNKFYEIINKNPNYSEAAKAIKEYFGSVEADLPETENIEELIKILKKKNAKLFNKKVESIKKGKAAEEGIEMS